MRVPRLVYPVLVLGLTLLVPRSARAQLISPGKLSSPHAELEGLRNCTQCHQLRQRGIAADRCLACHEPLATRIAVDSGLHRGGEYEPCASCHLDHQGVEYEMIRWEPDELDHREVGLELEEAHAALGCRDCHASPLVRDREVRVHKGRYGALGRTYLGLDATCAGCHLGDDPHEGGFDPQPCSDCHDQTDWAAASASFDHDQTRYPLTGRHRSVTCNDCHMADRTRGVGDYGGLAFSSCTDCHTDPHEGQMPTTCQSCHSTADWDRVRREDVEASFDHDRVYPLEEAHAAAECAACHSPEPRSDASIQMTYVSGLGATYPSPAADLCTSCHLDLHRGELGQPPSAAVCGDCHGQTDWYPSTFGISRHASETSFPLVGAHLATPCSSCHVNPLGAGQFVTDGSSCASCHAENQPHGAQFAERGCDDCHVEETFRIRNFDHEVTAYPLRGAHVSVTCAECHTEITDTAGARVVRYRPIAAGRCGDCHT